MEMPYELAAIASYNLGLFGDAAEYGRRAVELAPHDERIRSNLTWYVDANTAGSPAAIATHR